MSIKRAIERDKLFSIHPSRLRQPVLGAVDYLNSFPGPVQVVASALVFELYCRKFGIHRGTVGEIANNILGEVLERYPELRAARDCINKETS